MMRLARSPLGQLLTGWIFAHMSFAIPVQRLYETKSLVAFYHPRPAYPIHILIIPKKAIASLAELEPGEEFCAAFLSDLVACTQSLVNQLKLAESGYRLIANGGNFQDVAQLHFHLVSGESGAAD